ncbi:MAG: methionine ABC transporter ATP-binding protein [Eggerthellaceae bacterium]|nr:methionine ABC transporter ATP-binding protein [Eggerthellaceae bacterium]
MIDIQHLCKTYNASAETAHHALEDVNLTIRDGDIFGIIGASGAGKSTLVRCINLLERPTSGKILIDGKDVTDFSGKQLLQLRASIGMIFQNFSLFQQRTVLRNVTFPLELRHEGKAEREKRARELLEVVELSDKADRYPSQLSGGQQQRVAIARALANNPKIMLCDEATSALDTRTTVSILKLLKEINSSLGVTMVVITHSLAVAQKICNRIAVIDGGRIVEEGTTAEVFSNPQSPVTRELIQNDSLANVEGEVR